MPILCACGILTKIETKAMAAMCAKKKTIPSKRESVVRVVSSAAAIPAALAARMAERQEFLLGAALRLLPFLDASLPGAELLLEGGIPPSQRPEAISLLLSAELICRPVEEIQEQRHSRKAAELLPGYGADDPYALCAAYLLLEREKDALVNLNCLTAVVMVCATRHLPWIQDDFDARAEPFEQGRPDYRLRYVYSETAEDGEDMYSIFEL